HKCGAWANGQGVDSCGPAAGYSEGNCLAPMPALGQGTIMSYCDQAGQPGVSFTVGFGTQPGNLIRTNVSGANCATIYRVDSTLKIADTTLLATRECMNDNETFYWNDNNTIDEDDDVLILKIKPGSNNIGNLDNVGFEVKQITLPGYGSDTSGRISL